MIWINGNSGMGGGRRGPGGGGRRGDAGEASVRQARYGLGVQLAPSTKADETKTHGSGGGGHEKRISDAARSSAE